MDGIEVGQNIRILNNVKTSIICSYTKIIGGDALLIYTENSVATLIVVCCCAVILRPR